MKKVLFAFAAIAVAAVACTKEKDVDQPVQRQTRQITVVAQTPETKVTLDDQHNALQWTASDNIRIMTNTADASHDAQTLGYTANGKFTVTVGTDATEAYAYYKAGDFTNTDHSTPTAFAAYIDAEQTQTEAGVFNGEWLPMAAKGTIEGDVATLAFHPMAGVLALNIYNTNKPAGEKIAKVTVKPDAANTHFCGLYAGVDLTQDDVIYAQGTSTSHTSVSVTLGTAYDYATAKPTDKRMAPGQIYVVLAKQNYKSVKFEIETEAGEKYEITSSATTGLDLENNDFYAVNINLDKATKVVAYEESFASSQGLFTTEGTAGIWNYDSSHSYMKGTSYINGNNTAATAWLISPIIQVNSSESVLSFEQCINKYFGTVANEATVWVREVGGEWSQLTGFDYPSTGTGTWSQFEEAAIALGAAKNGKSIQIGFKYIGSTTAAGTWEIKNFKVTYAELLQPKAFSVTTASPIEVPADPTGNSYSIAIEADSDVAWTAVLTEGDANALALSTASGTGNGTIDLTIGKNTGTARSWKIVVSSSAYVATPSYTIQVVQAKGTTGSTSDIINRAFTGVSGTSYSTWSGKTGQSGAVYAGNSAGGNDAIQLRSTNSNSGIITTASGGNVKKVTITWNDNTAATRTVSIYGKASAYSAASDLYNSTDQGTLLGELNIDNASSNVSELTVAGNYQYIGIRSKSGALYIDEIEIEWSTEAAATYNITIDPDIEHGSVTASKATGVAEGESVTLTVTPSSGYQLATLIVDGNDVTSSVSNKKYTFSMPAKNINVTATFSLIPTYSITVDPNIEHGTVTPSKSTGIVEGESITLTIAPESGYVLESLEVGGTDVTSSVSANKYIFDMPSNDVSVNASFIAGTAPTTTYTMTISSSQNAANSQCNVVWYGQASTTLTYNNVSWNASVEGTTNFVGANAYCTIGTKSSPATKITLSTTAFGGKTIVAARLKGNCSSNTGPALTIKGGSTTMLDSEPLIKTTATVYESTNNNVALAEGDALTFEINSSASAGITIYYIEVEYK